jgi:uncharacterized protein YyaL (SSP411 family)
MDEERVDDDPGRVDDGPTTVRWREWGAAPFAEARERSCPVLLSLTATWCQPCHEMDRTTYADPRVAAAVHDRFVPVRVDVDRRPRVRERYHAGGFPTTAFLTPEGTVMTSAGALDADTLRDVLDRVAATHAERGDDAGRVPRSLAGDAPPAGEVTPAIEAHLAGQLAAQYDDDHGGWGRDAKFPLPRTLEFALKRDLPRADLALDAVRDGLRDDDGGFFRFAANRDWTEPSREKPLDVEAGLCRAFANAYLHTGDDGRRETATGVAAFLDERLWTGAAFGGSVGADGRRDTTAYAGPNALAADALLALAAYVDDADARERAETTLSYLDDRLVRDGAVRRYDGDDAPPAPLDDRAHLVRAYARAGQVLGGDWADRARAVADETVATLRTGDGSFRDGPADGAGLLDRPLRPLDGNAHLANALLDLAALTGETRYRDVARGTVAAFAGAHERFGVQVAAYGAAAARLTDGGAPVVAVADEPGSTLHRAALRIADHETVVRPDADGDPGTARVRTEGETAWSEPAGDPEALMARVRGRT